MSNKKKEPTDEMLDQYDFSGGVRGKYTDRFSDDCNLIVLDPDVAKAFPDANAVNEALREVIHQRTKQAAKSSTR